MEELEELLIKLMSYQTNFATAQLEERMDGAQENGSHWAIERERALRGREKTCDAIRMLFYREHERAARLSGWLESATKILADVTANTNGRIDE